MLLRLVMLLAQPHYLGIVLGLRVGAGLSRRGLHLVDIRLPLVETGLELLFEDALFGHADLRWLHLREDAMI